MTDEQLQTLITRICENRDFQSKERRRDIHRLLLECQRLPGLKKSSHLLYSEALDKTWEWVITNICDFERQAHLSVQTTLVRWINGYLKWRIKDLYLKQANQHCREISLDAPINKSSENSLTFLDILSENSIDTPTLSGIDNYIKECKAQKFQKIYEQFKQEVEEDPKHIFKNSHPRQHPDCNFRFLCQKLIFKDPPEKLSHISRKLGINYNTLITFWKRKCIPLLQKKLKELGYSGDLKL